MIIEESDFRLIPCENSFDLELLYTVNKGKKNERKEFKNVAYGLQLDNAIQRIIMYRLNNKFETVTLKEFLKEYKDQLSKIKDLCV